MKHICFALCTLLLLSACNNKKENESASVKPAPTEMLDSLLTIPNEKALIEIFGDEFVTTDSVYDSEGNRSIVSLIYPGTVNQVEVFWKNKQKKSGMEKVRLNAFFDEQNEVYLPNSRWKTSFGVTLGTSLKELERINQTPFIFFGFGWDYGGFISEYNTGKLGQYPLTIQLGIIDIKKQGNDPDYEMLMGDNEFNSDDPEAQRLNPIVISISIHNPGNSK
jgi:hypothetical protein